MAKSKTRRRKTIKPGPKTISCHHCKYRWQYKGKSPFYVTCPRCYYKVRVGK